MAVSIVDKMTLPTPRHMEPGLGNTVMHLFIYFIYLFIVTHTVHKRYFKGVKTCG